MNVQYPVGSQAAGHRERYCFVIDRGAWASLQEREEMLVTIERMEALVAVIETGSFSAAARRMGKTPSAISRIVQHFELDLGVDLFDRVERQAPVVSDVVTANLQESMRICPRFVTCQRIVQLHEFLLMGLGFSQSEPG